MLKQFMAWVVLVAILVSTILWRESGVNATNASPWISSDISIQKQADTHAVPTSLNGNTDCTMDGIINCASPTIYGMATQNSSVKLNGSSAYMPVNTYIENRPRFIPVTNSNTAISYTAEPAYGIYLYFNYNFSSSIKQETDFSGPHYQITRSPDGVLADKTTHRLAADYESMSFSKNGRWMVVSDPNEAMLRVNLSTFEVLPFAPGFNYTIGVDSSLKTAISNDGRYAVVASQGFSSWKIYDLSTCSAVPDSISGPVDCQSRDVKSVFNQQISGYSFASYIRFIDNDILSAYVNYKVGDANKTARFIVSNKITSNQLEYLALGDSYISGEGAFDYRPSTDDSDNRCHLSLLAYPYLIGHDLNYDSYQSVACSGAAIGDVTDTSISTSTQNEAQAKDKAGTSFDDEIYNNFLPGYRAQINFINRYQPKVITLSVGGNDMGFSSILKSCVDLRSFSTCYSTYEDRLELVNLINNIVYPRLVDTYQQIKTASPPDARIYVIGYPQIAKPDGDCALNVHFNNDEVVFSQRLIAYFDSVIKIAAAKSGVYYVDTQDALNGHRLCEAGPGSVAVNGLTAGNDSPSRSAGPIGNESYHPNPFGYELLENKILAGTHNLTVPMPPSDTSAVLPEPANQAILNAPHSNRQVRSVEYDNDIASDLAYQQVPLDISINGAAHSLTPGSSIQAEIHSEPFSLGTFNLDQNGNLSTRLTIPSNVSAGYHTLHFYGTDINGQSVDIYKYVYLASTADDLDGNGITDSTQGCIGMSDSGQDYDHDGVDDACDANISQPSVTPASFVFTNTALEPVARQNVSSSNSTVANQPKVLSASTIQPNPDSIASDADAVRVPDSDLIFAGLAMLLISALAWTFL